MRTITVRAGDQTPRDLRYLDGREFKVNNTTPVPSSGTLFGIPGVLQGGDDLELRDGLVWEIVAPKPASAEQPGVGLGDLLAVLTEIRDLLKPAEQSPLVRQADELGKALNMEKWLGTPAEMIDLPSFGMTLADYRKQVHEQWSAPAAASTDSSSATGTAPTEPSDGKG